MKTLEKKHFKGKMHQSLTIFGYKFEVYENVVIFYDNEEPDKSIEMQHHTFEAMLKFYNEV